MSRELDTMSVGERAIVLSFVYMQLIVFVVAAVVMSGLGQDTMRFFSSMPPVSAIYTSVSAEWISRLLHFGYGMSALANVVLGIVTVMLAMKSRTSNIRFLGAFFGVQLVLTGLLCSATVIILEIGGMAHLVSVLLVLSATLTSGLTLMMVVSKFKFIKQFISDGDAP